MRGLFVEWDVGDLNETKSENVAEFDMLGGARFQIFDDEQFHTL